MDWDIQFLEPNFLKLLFVPVIIFLLLIRRLYIRRSEVSRLKKSRSLPVSEKYLFFGRLLFWMIIANAIALFILSLARPAKILSVKNESSVDLVVLQDGSASMRVNDIIPDRWQRSLIFLRNLTENLEWKGDRLGLASFARLTSPFIRLTTDPNTVLFFIDHLKIEPPFKLYENSTWDTNIASGIEWGIKLINKDREIYGFSKNPQAMILISDGQAWSGELDDVFNKMKNKIPIFVIGIGTTGGGYIPEFVPTEPPQPPTYSVDDLGDTVEIPAPPGPQQDPIQSSLDRTSLRKIASMTGGDYFEIDTEPDNNIALKIINRVKNSKIVGGSAKRDILEELYWYFMLAAGVLILIATLIFR